MECHLDYWAAGKWQPLATVSAPKAGGFVITYEHDYAIAQIGAIDARAISASLPVALRPYTFDRWPAFLRDLIPQGESRKRLARLLGIADTAEQDWTLLTHGGGNPIGHLRVREAAEWLHHQGSSGVGWTLDDITNREDSFLDALECLGPTPGNGSQGEWPKVMLTEARNGRWYLDHELPDAEAVRHWIVKLPRRSAPVFDLILRGEAAYHRVACDLGLTVGETQHHNGALFIERFDRRLSTGGGVQRIAQESLYAAAGCLGSDTELTHRQACQQLNKIMTHPEPAILQYVWRDLLNLALGNRDNHGRNTAIQRFEGVQEDGMVALAPVFDLAPMLMHPDGVVRRMRWGQENGSRPDWRAVAEWLDEEQLLPQALLLGQLPVWQEALATLPGLLKQYDCPPEVLARIDAPHTECLQNLKEAIAWTNALRP